MATKKETKNMETKKYSMIAGALLLAFMMGRWSTSQSPAPAGAETQRVRSGRVEQSDVTVQQLQEVLNKNRRTTSLQREEALGNYINKQVQWKGILKSAYNSEGKFWGIISHRIKPSWFLGQRHVQVTVNFADSQKETLLNAQKGSLVTYQGVLSEYTGSAKRPWLLTDGQILSVEIVKPKATTKPRLQ
jgi:hypothetical protein